MGIESMEGFAEIFPLAQDSDPGEAGLETVQHQFFIKRPAVIFRHAPLFVVIGDIERVFAGPGAALFLSHNLSQSGLEMLTGMLSAVSGAFASSRRSSRTSAKPPDP